MADNTQPLVITKPATITEVAPPKDGKHHASVTILLDDKEGLPGDYGRTPKLLADTRIWSMELLQADMNHETKGEIVFEIVKGDRGNTNFLSKWNGIEKPPFEGNKGGGRRGGGGNYTPKTPAEIHAPSIGGIIKSALESCVSAGHLDKAKIDTVIGAGVDSYIGAIKRVNAELAPAPKAESTTEAA